MFISILGRQPELSIAELRAVYSQSNVDLLTPEIASVESENFDISILGGTTKYGLVIDRFASHEPSDKAAFIAASRKIVQHYQSKWRQIDHKITLGISAYNFKISPRDVQKTGLLLKSSLKKSGISLRLIPNSDPALSTAVSHNNKLGLSPNKVELMIIKAGKTIVLAESRGAQNITAYAKRDRDRPRRDAFVGMLPPKLAQIMINLAAEDATTTSFYEGSAFPAEASQERKLDQSAASRPEKKDSGSGRSITLLDPFCGTGTILQEALLRDFTVFGSDLNPKMIDYTTENLSWLQKTHRADGTVSTIRQGDATEFKWLEAENLDLIVCETYLGQPFSAPPSPEKLKQVVGNCNHIISQFLENIRAQIKPETRLCIAVPAWQGNDGRFTYLPLTKQVQSLGYQLQNTDKLLYHRPDQVVARQLLILRPSAD